MTSSYALTNFEVQYWTGSAWAAVPGGIVTGNDKVWRKLSFPTLTTSKIRLYVTSVAGDNRSQVVELEASGQPTLNWLVADHLGTPRMVLDKTGSLANMKRHDYLPFGEELYAGTGGRTTGLGHSGDTIRQKFTSYERDSETQLDYAQARYYASTQGRFTSVDPLMASASTVDPQTFNRYTYAMNSPTNITDPSGMLAMDNTSAMGQFAQNWGPGWDVGGIEEEPKYQVERHYFYSVADPTAVVHVEGQAGTQETQNQPLTSVTVLRNNVKIKYAGGISAADRLAASSAISAAAGLINDNADDLTSEEKKAIGKIKSFSVVGPGVYVGATVSGLRLDVGRINGYSTAWLASVFGHEGQHDLNDGKYFGSNLWRDEQSALRMQLGIGNKLGITSAQRTFLERSSADSNRDAMQRHMLRGLKSQ